MSLNHNFKAQLLDVKKQINFKLKEGKRHSNQSRYKVVVRNRTLGEQFYDRISVTQNKRLIASVWRG